MTQGALTEATLAELHSELAERLKACHGKPLMITVSYKGDDDRLQHWMGLNNEYSYDDVELTLKHLTKQAQDHHQPKNAAVMKAFKSQFQTNRDAKLRNAKLRG